jgi:hypothetical protein
MNFKFWSGEEDFLLIEIGPHELNAALVAFDSEKRLRPKRIWRNTTWNALSGPVNLRRFVKHVVFAVDSSLAYTAIIPMRILRDNPSSLLFGTEFENLLAQEAGKFYNQCRLDASRELGMDDLDMVLAHSRVGSFKVDGHPVINPIGHKAQKFEAVLELSLTTREVMENARDFLKGRQNFFFIEIGRAELLALERVGRLPLKMLRLGHESSSLVTAEDALVGHSINQIKMSWGLRSLTDAIMQEWGVDRATAAELYESYLYRDMAPRAGEFFSKVLAESMVPLFNLLAQAKLKGRVYVETPIPLPFELPLKRGKLELEYPPLGRLLDQFGFHLRMVDWPLPGNRLLALLAPFLAYYHDRSDSTVNRWLRRHLNWLGSPIGH